MIFSICMEIFIPIRVFFLGNPLKTSHKESIINIFFEYLWNNFRFTILANAVILFVIFSFIAKLYRRNKAGSTFLLYTSGSILLYTALSYKYVSILASSKLDGTKSYITPLDRMNEMLINAPTNLLHLVAMQIGLITSHKLNLFNKKNWLADTELNLNNMSTSNEDSNEIKENIKIILDKNRKKETSRAPGDSKTTKDQKRVLDKINEELKDIGKSKEKSDKNLDDDFKEKVENASEVKIPKSGLDRKDSKLKNQLNIDNPRKIISLNKDETVMYLEKNKNSPSDENIKTNDSKEDIFMKEVLNTMKEEFKDSSKTEEYFRSINDQIQNVLYMAGEFSTLFDQFYKISMKIEPEMASFNASTKYFKEEALEMADLLKKNNILVDIGKTFETLHTPHLGFDRSSEKNSNNSRFKPILPINTPPLLNGIRIFLLLQFFFALFFLLAVFCKIEYIFVAKFLVFICLCANIILSIYFLLISQLLDKKCITGDAFGCKSIFTKHFTEFAASANIDLSDYSKTKLKITNEKILKLESQAENTVNLLKKYLISDPTNNFKYHAILFKSLFNKILFVRDDFEQLTNNKVDKKLFYNQVEDLDNLIDKIRNALDNIERERLIDIYTKELIFLDFIKKKKTKILSHTSDQLDKALIMNKNSEEMDCNDKRRKICILRGFSDKVFVLFLFGGILLTLLLLY